MKKKCLSLKPKKKNADFLTQFGLGSISNGLSATESREVSLNRNLYDFSVDYNSIEKFDMLSIQEYLMTKINIKQCSALLYY